MIRKSMIISISAAVLLVLTSYGWVQMQMQRQPVHSPSVATVGVIKVKAQNYQPSIEAVGILQANQGTLLKAQTDGQVMKINFAPGQTVQAQDVLVELNNTQQQGALFAAIAQEKLNQAMYQRDLELKKLGAISLAALDQAKSALDVGTANVQEAQGAYDLTLIKAPFSGRVGISKINIGDYLQSADSIVSLQNLNPMFVDFYVPEKYFPAIKIGATVNVVTDTLPGKVFTGEIVNYETVIDEDTGTLQVRASVPNPQEMLLPGGYVTVSAHVGAPSSSINIPQTSLVYDDKGVYVYLVREGKAIRQNVIVGDQIKQTIQVTAGLKSGDIIISAGTNKVHEGSAVHEVFEAGE